MDDIKAFVDLDVHKDKISVAIAEAGRSGEVRLWGTVPNNGHAIDKLMKKLSNRHGAMEIAYEAGPCGYGIYRRLSSQGYVCRVVAPSRIPRKSGDRIENDTRDAIALARLLRAGELSFVWVPDEVHEAMRDLVRARHAASNDVRRTRQRILKLPATTRASVSSDDLALWSPYMACRSVLRASSAADCVPNVPEC